MRALPVVLLLASCTSPGEELASLAEEGATCSSDGDCCAVVDGCEAQAYVIGKADFERAKELAADAAESEVCVKCIAPLVDVRCNPDTKRCEGRGVPYPETGPAPENLGDHCGAVIPDAWPAETGQLTLGCGAG